MSMNPGPSVLLRSFPPARRALHPSPGWIRAVDRVVVIGLILLGVCPRPVPAQTPAPGRWVPPPENEALLDGAFDQPVRTELAAEVQEMIASLGDPSYKKRQAATRRLIDLGPPVFAPLRDVYRTNDDFEVRLRIEHIIREGYLRHFVYGHNAFLGIRQGMQPATHDTDPHIQEGFVGIVIGGIIEDTAAEAARLKPKDIIIEVDGEPIPQVRNMTNRSFGESIRVRGPGARITLTVLRGGSLFTREVILRSRPKRYYRGPQGTVTSMLQYYTRRFNDFWVRHFQPSKEGSSKRQSSS